MNGRIQKLAEQAEAHYRANVLGASMYKIPPNRLMEKFAELIVEECIFAIDEQCSNSDAEGTIEAITILQKHFRS